jgi:lysophospholipase L1-like esterase
MKRRQTALACLFPALLAVTPALADDFVGLTPLMDMQPGESYLGFQGGLYPDATNAIPVPHLVGGMVQARAVRPLDAAGQPAANGRIVLLTIGMSNTSQESTAFRNRLQTFAGENPALVFVNGAQGGQTASIIANPSANFWTVVDQRLTQMGVTPQQVQAVWYKEANAGPTNGFPAYAVELRDQSTAIMQIIKSRYPNTRLVYTSSRIYAGYATTALNPEPYAYESGFAMKWLITDQIAGNPALNYRPAAGPVVAPWIQWGPYTWADGVVPRSDGLTWVATDFQADGTHPSTAGANKVAEMLLAFFANAPTARIWFLAPGQGALLGDMNGDNVLDFFDVDPFLLALFDRPAYETQFPGLNAVERGDVTQDGSVDFFDIDGFVALLFAI